MDARLPAVPPVVRRLLLGSAGVLVVAVLLGGPVRSWMSQRAQIADAGARLAAIDSDNSELRRRLVATADPAAVETAARRELGMVRPGEESYTVLPPATDGLVLPRSWPFEHLAAAIVDSKAPTTTVPPAAGAQTDQATSSVPTTSVPPTSAPATPSQTAPKQTAPKNAAPKNTAPKPAAPTTTTGQASGAGQ